MNDRSARLLVVVPNLFFATRILATARAMGVESSSASLARAIESCRAFAPDRLIVDLEQPGDVVEAIRRLKADPVTRSVRVVGFYSHVHKTLRQSALEAGADVVLPRSAFTAQLSEVVAGKGGTPAGPGLVD